MKKIQQTKNSHKQHLVLMAIILLYCILVVVDLQGIFMLVGMIPVAFNSGGSRTSINSVSGRFGRSSISSIVTMFDMIFCCFFFGFDHVYVLSVMHHFSSNYLCIQCGSNYFTMRREKNVLYALAHRQSVNCQCSCLFVYFQLLCFSRCLSVWIFVLECRCHGCIATVACNIYCIQQTQHIAQMTANVKHIRNKIFNSDNNSKMKRQLLVDIEFTFYYQNWMSTISVDDDNLNYAPSMNI